MEACAALFAGAVDVIREREEPQPCSWRSSTDAEVLALLRRRPCTVEGVSAGLGMHPHEAAKQLETLCRQGTARPVRKANEVFYEAERTS
jgi:hypothetical protein